MPKSRVAETCRPTTAPAGQPQVQLAVPLVATPPRLPVMRSVGVSQRETPRGQLRGVESHQDKKGDFLVSGTYDIIAVGGGLGGATLAKVMAERGARVLVLERERQFRDRVRGEVMVSWGAAEARELGIYKLLLDTCGRELRWFAMSIGPESEPPRDLTTTTPQRPGSCVSPCGDAGSVAPSGCGCWGRSAPGGICTRGETGTIASGLGWSRMASSGRLAVRGSVILQYSGDVSGHGPWTHIATWQLYGTQQSQTSGHYANENSLPSEGRIVWPLRCPFP